MALPACTICEAETGVLMDTTLTDGDTTIVGPACLPGYALSIAAACTRGLPAEAGDAFGGLFDQISANDPRSPQRPPEAPASVPRKRKGATAAEPLPDGALAAPAASAAPELNALAGAHGIGRLDMVDDRQPCFSCGSTECHWETDKVECASCGATIATKDEAPF